MTEQKKEVKGILEEGRRKEIDRQVKGQINHIRGHINGLLKMVDKLEEKLTAVN